MFEDSFRRPSEKRRDAFGRSWAAANDEPSGTNLYVRTAALSERDYTHQTILR
jgi:hypothetical protein